MRLEELQPNATVNGVTPDGAVTVVQVERHGSEALTLFYRSPVSGKVAEIVLYRDDEERLSLVDQGHRPWRFDGDGALFRLVSEAYRIRLAHLFDPLLAVHTSFLEPLPHQIIAVYEAMLPRQPLRFLLADDPGAGKTIMAGLLMRELIARGDLKRCLVVCPGSLTDQWQGELHDRFHLPFEIMTRDKIDTARAGSNWFVDNDLVIARLDMLARSDDLRDKLNAPDCRFDLVICDEAHKMSASFSGGEVSYTKRYHLGQLLSGLTRHLLLMTATPHNGKEEDFQLFMALLDPDRFEGRFRDGTHQADVSDLMRRTVKEDLRRFDGRPLFPERMAHSVSYELSDDEMELYREVTAYVRDEFNRAEALDNNKRYRNIGFALTILQRRLASSPEAIWRSLQRRRERLEARRQEIADAPRRDADSAPAPAAISLTNDGSLFDPDELDDLDDAPNEELEAAEAAVLDQATAAGTIAELDAEIASLTRLEALADRIRRAGEDAKWSALSDLLDTIFTPATFSGQLRVEAPAPPPYGSGPLPPPSPSTYAKLVLFTEHRDTLDYLHRRIETRMGRPHAIVTIHGGMNREARLRAQTEFRNNPEVRILLATDAAGEGINLQRAHLMVNYDLPWNPNRLEQRFGRIHRIGQTEVCHLWNLVAERTREGDVYLTLLEKLEQARQSLGGKVFDVLGSLRFGNMALRDLLIEAVRHGDRPDVRMRLDEAVSEAVDRPHLEALLDQHALAHDAMDPALVNRVRDDMERAAARRLQPHYIGSFFREAFRRLKGTLYERAPSTYEITHVPAPVRDRARQVSVGGGAVAERYERIVFDHKLLDAAPKPEFVCPGHPLLDGVLALTLEHNRDLLQRGAVLVDESDPGTAASVLFMLEHSIRDKSQNEDGTTDGEEGCLLSRRLLFVRMDADGCAEHSTHAPYLDYRPLAPDEPTAEAILARPECAWATPESEQHARNEAITRIVPEHLREVSEQRSTWVAKARTAVRDRLTKEIAHWDRRAEELKLRERSGRGAGARLNSGEAARRANEMQARLKQRTAQLDRQEQVSALPPKVIGGALVVPMGLLQAMSQGDDPSTKVDDIPPPTPVMDTQTSAARAREVVMETERSLGFEPTDYEFEKRGYDIESRDPRTGHLRFIEVKGRVASADTVKITRNEIITALNAPDEFILALVVFSEDDGHLTRYLRRPFKQEPEFGVTAVDYRLDDLLARAEEPS